ncbi:MAG: ParA family protein [SAR324 cluster bacterium]|nr:ParA family protein [SAR324 cluster bacterium]MBF0349854.1 ParA family protein [SAR324 cluster bacterium]
MTVRIAIMSMKGGQAKTGLAINLAARIAKAKREVLLIDSDVQANVTTVFQRDHVCNLANVVLGRVKKFDFLELGPYFSFLPSGGKLMVEAGRYISNSRFRETIVRNSLEPLNQNIIIIDCAPSWSEVNENILMYVDYVIIPVVTDYLGYSGCDQVMTYIEELKRESRGQCHVDVLGIAITRYNSRTNISRTIVQGLQEHWSDLLFQNVIEESVSIQEAPAFHQSIFDYKEGKTKGALMYDALCREILKRISEKQLERSDNGPVS